MGKSAGKSNHHRSFHTYAEKRMMDYGTKKMRLGKDSQIPFGHCFLSLAPYVFFNFGFHTHISSIEIDIHQMHKYSSSQSLVTSLTNLQMLIQVISHTYVTLDPQGEGTGGLSFGSHLLQTGDL